MRLSTCASLVFVLAFAAGEEAWAAKTADDFAAANLAYEQGDFELAQKLYARVEAARPGSWAVAYNRGNAEMRLNRVGEAIAAYRRSLRLAPRQRDVRASLDFARKKIADDIKPAEPSTAVRTFAFWHFLLSPRETQILLLVSWGLAAVLALVRRVLQRAWVSALLVGCTVVVVAAGSSLVAHQLVPRQVAVIVAPEADAYAGQSERSLLRFRVHEGAELALLERQPQWLRVALPSGDEAWIPASTAATVSF